MSEQIIIKNGIIITLDEKNPILKDHMIVINNGIIENISKSENINNFNGIVIDAKNKIILPGFINSHMHFYSTFATGITNVKPSKNFKEILNNLWWKLDKTLTLEDTYYSTLIMCLNAIRHGTTTLIDHHASPFSVENSLDHISNAILESGLRGCLCYEVSDRDGKDIAKAGIKENQRFIKKCNNNPNNQIKALFGLHASFTLSDETIKESVEIANELNSGFHIHVAESESDQIDTMSQFGKRVVNRLYDLGVLGEKTIAAHSIHLNENEIELFAKTKTIVVHNPQSNMNNAVGIADIIKLMDRKILVGLGTDAMTVNMQEELRVALWAQHLLHKNPSVGFENAIKTLFENNAIIANRIWDKINIGKIKESYVADIVLLDYVPPTPIDESNYFGHLVFGASQATVDTTIVNGKVLMKNKKIQLDIDEEELCEKARELANKVRDRF